MSSPCSNVNITPVVHQLVLQLLAEMGRGIAETGHPVDDVDRKVVAVDFVKETHIEGRGRGAFLFVSAYVQQQTAARAGERQVDG